MRAAVTLLVLLFFLGGVQTRSTQTEAQPERQSSGTAAAAAAAAAVNPHLDVSAEITELKDTVYNLGTLVQELQATLTFSQEQIINIRTLLYKTTDETKTLREDYNSLSQTSAAQQVEVTTLTTRLATSETEVENLKQGSAAQQSDLNVLKARLDTSETEVENLKQGNAAQQVEVTSLKTRLATSETEVENLKQGSAAQQSDLNVLKTRLDTSETEVDHLKQGNAAQQLEMIALKTRLDTSEMEVEHLKEENSALQADMSTTRTEMMNLIEVNAAQDVELTVLKTGQATSAGQLEDLKQANTVQSDALAGVSAGLAATDAEVETLKAETTGKPKVAFSAGLLDHAGYVEAGDARRSLVFRKVTTNVGDAYSGVTGIFQAPVRGVYYFRFTVKDYLSARHMDISMWRNAEQVAWLDGYDTAGHAAYLSTGATLRLEAGDAVNLRIRAGHRLYDSYGEHSTFSGFLLFPL